MFFVALVTPKNGQAWHRVPKQIFDLRSQVVDEEGKPLYNGNFIRCDGKLEIHIDSVSPNDIGQIARMLGVNSIPTGRFDGYGEPEYLTLHKKGSKRPQLVHVESGRVFVAK